MGPFPKNFEEEIKKLHPKLTDEDFGEYLRLIYTCESLLQNGRQEESKHLEGVIEEFVRTHMPRMDEAYANFHKKMAEYENQSLLSELPSPVDIALADEKVAGWIRERTLRSGAYSVDSKLIRDPDVYLVEFRFEDDSVLKAEVERMENNVHIGFQRTILR